MKYRVRVGRRLVTVNPADPASMQAAGDVARAVAAEDAPEVVKKPVTPARAARDAVRLPAGAQASTDYTAIRAQIREIYAAALRNAMIQQLMVEKLAQDDEDAAEILLLFS